MTELEKLLLELAGPPKTAKLMIRGATEHNDYVACPIAVLQRPRQPDSPAAGEFSSYGEYPSSRVAAVANLTPDVMLAPGALRVDGDDRRRLLESKQMMIAPIAPDGARLGILPGDKDKDGTFRATSVIRLVPTCDLGEGAVHASLQEPLRKACQEHQEMKVSVTRLRGTASKFMAVIEHGDELLYALMEADEAPAVHEIVMADGCKLRPDAWNDKDRCYKRLRTGERKMKGLGNPITGRREPVAKQEPVTTPEVSQAEIDQAATAPIEATVVVDKKPAAVQAEIDQAAAAPVSPAVVVPAAAGAQSAPAPEPASAPDAEQPKRVRRAPQATGKYSVAGLQQLAGDMAAQPDPSGVDQIDAIIDEMRAVRDLQIASARRMANLGTAIAKLTRGAVEKYSQIQALLK